MIALLPFYFIIITIIISKQRCRLLQCIFLFQRLKQKTVHKTKRERERKVFPSDLRLSDDGMLVWPLGRLRHRCPTDQLNDFMPGQWPTRNPHSVIKKKKKNRFVTCVYVCINEMSTYYLKKSHILNLISYVRTHLVAASVLCYWVQGRNTLHFVFSFSLTS